MSNDVKLADAKTSHCSERVWAAAYALKEYMMKVDISPECQILELGSGTGWLSLELAAANKTAAITATDHPDYMFALRESIRLSSTIKNVEARGLDWGSPWTEEEFQRYNTEASWIIGYGTSENA
jgi:methylase of polypeptide subunit release factors